MDTGADISICKKGNISEINSREISILSGITLESMESIGTTNLNLHFDDKRVEHKFHVVPNDFPIPTDGIIGRDVLQKYRCKIDFDNYTTTFNIENEEFILPMDQKCICIVDVCIPKRSESIIPVNVRTNKDSIIFKKEIAPGVFVANSIIPAIGTKHLKILNTNEKDIFLNKIEVEKEDLNKYHIYDYSKDISSQNISKTNRVLKDLNIESIDPTEIEKGTENILAITRNMKKNQ